MYAAAVGGRHAVLFWTVFCSVTLLECFAALFEPWLLGLWASQYDHHAPSEVNVSLYVTFCEYSSDTQGTDTAIKISDLLYGIGLLDIVDILYQPAVLHQRSFEGFKSLA